MFYNQTIKIALFISLTGHFLVLGLPLDLLKLKNPKKHEYITVHIEKPRPLPKIEKMGDEKILKGSKSISKKAGNNGNIVPQNKIETTSPAKEAMLRYQDMIKQRIEETRWYPEWAKERKYEGTVRIKFSIHPDGQLGTIHILHPSGYKILDKSGVETIKNASPFPPIPKEISQNLVNIKISIVYLLKD